MKSLDYEAIAKRLKDRRTSLSMSYQELADKASMSKSTLQRYETGKIKNIPIARLQALSSALGMDPNELIGVKPPRKLRLSPLPHPSPTTPSRSPGTTPIWTSLARG